MLPGVPREKEGNKLLEFGLGLSVTLRFSSSSGVLVQADRALNVCPIRCRDGPVTITFEGAWHSRLVRRIKVNVRI